MGSGSKNKKITMGAAPFDDESWEAYRWAINNDILISPKAVTEAKWYIVIENKGKINLSPEPYGKTEIWTKIFEYYKFYFNKYGKHRE